MPELYHFTTKYSFHFIVSDELILPSVVCVGTPSRNHRAVCLTSDPNPEGHGLPDGREVTHKEAVLLGRVFQINGKYFCHDHTLIRLKINIPDTNENLVYVPPLFNKYPRALFDLDVSGYFPCTTLEAASAEQVQIVAEALRSGHLKRKSETWWYYFCQIPLEWVVEIGIRVEHSQYISTTRDAFLEQWKPEIPDMHA
jgi:hypothetical protein